METQEPLGPTETRPTTSRGASKFATSARLIERRMAVWELRKTGLSYRAIGERLGVSDATVYADIHACFERFNSMTEKDVENARRLELERLDAIQAAWWDRAVGSKYQPAEERAVRVIDAVMSQRNKLLGLYAPAQARVDVSVTLDQIIADAPAAVAAVEANRSEREAFLASRGKPVPQLEGPENVLDADYEEEALEGDEQEFEIGEVG